MGQKEDQILSRLESLTHSLNLEDAAKEMLFSLSKDIFLVVDEKEEIKYASPAFNEILGYSPRKEVVGRTWKTFLHPIEGEWSWTKFEKEGSISRIQISHLSKQKELIVVDWNCVFEPCGKHWYCVGRTVKECEKKGEKYAR